MHCSGHFKPILVYKGGAYKKGFRQSGNDRDAYVANNNGGFTAAHQPSTQLKPSTMYVAQPPRAINSMGMDTVARNKVKSHVVIYRQNGTGRDTYILNNNGGFAINEGENKFCGYQQDFKRSLRNYPPAEPKRNRSFSSVSPVRYKSLAGSFATTLNRFNVQMHNTQKQQTERSLSKKDTEQITVQMPEQGVSRQMIPTQHYRTQSQQINAETTDRVKKYLEQRKAFTKAQELQNKLTSRSKDSKGSGNKNGSVSCGRLVSNGAAAEQAAESNQRSRNLKGDMSNSLVGAKGKTQQDLQASLVLAVQSTPSLNNAFSKSRRSEARGKFLSQNNTMQQTLPTGGQPSDLDHTQLNLNILSHEDLYNNLDKEINPSRERSRPMTTKFGDRRRTQQPSQTIESNPILQNDFQSQIDGIYERHATVDKSPMQVFDQHQRLTCARLSVPHERRRRDRFDGTQNSFFGTVQHEVTPGISPINAGVPARNTVFSQRKDSNGSLGGVSPMRGTKVRSSLMGTTARQKLLQIKLIQHQKNDSLQADDHKAVKNQVRELRDVDILNHETADHLKDAQQPPMVKSSLIASRDAKRSNKERILAAVYKTQDGPQETGSARQTLKSNLRKNLKSSERHGRQMSSFHARHQSMQVPDASKDMNRTLL